MCWQNVRRSHFLKLNFKEDNLLPKEFIFVGSKAQKSIEKLGLNHVDVKNFLEKVKKTYIAAGLYIKRNLPLENQLLKSFTSIKPLLAASPKKLILKCLLNLPTLVQNALNDLEEQDFEDQVRALLVDSNLPAVLVGGNNNDNGREVDCVSWWLMVKPKYPNTLNW